MTRIMISECTCPACGAKLDAAPSRKTRCPSCAQFMYVRTAPADRRQYLVTEDEVEIIDREWRQCHDNQANQPQHTEQEYERLFSVPLQTPINTRGDKGMPRRSSGTKAEPVRWVLGPWCEAHCRRIVGHPSCSDVAGEYDEWDCLPTVPGGAELACKSEEFMAWWDDHHRQDEVFSGCDCHLEVYHKGVWQKGM